MEKLFVICIVGVLAYCFYYVFGEPMDKDLDRISWEDYDRRNYFD